MSDTHHPSALEDYLFDLRGYLVLKNAVDAKHVAIRSTASLAARESPQRRNAAGASDRSKRIARCLPA